MPERRRITIVNDSGPFLELMAELLTQEGHAVTTFDGRRTDVEQVAATRPDLIILDLRLSDSPALYRGWDLLQEARDSDALASTPILVCTAAVEAIRERLGSIADTPALAVILKPFDIEELLVAIDRLLRLPHSERSWPPTATVVQDLETRILDASDDALAFLHYERGQLIGRRAAELVTWPPEMTQHELGRALAEGAWHGVVSVRDGRGEERRVPVNVRRERIAAEDVLVTRMLIDS